MTQVITVPGYDQADVERYAVEPASELKRTGGERTPFQRDRARVLHSLALRRLAGKTQVVTPGESDFPRTRLTHSLEVAQIGRELAGSLGADPDLVEAACLAHDLGHPPFGHTGEAALNEVTGAIGGFEGNAQNLRILTRLEAKVVRADGRSAGLNPTRGLLDAATKYPWTRRPGNTKFGAYSDDLPVFSWLRIGAPPDPVKCFEAQIMDWSDDVAYSVHDLEDAIYAGHVDPRILLVEGERAALFERSRGYAPDAEPAELAAALDRLQTLEWWPADYDRSFAAQARLKGAASELIGRFCLAVVRATRSEFGPGPHTRYNAHLVVPRPIRLENAVLKAVAARYVMETEHALALRTQQAALIRELVALLAARPEQLEPPFQAWWSEASDDGARLRVVVDQIASLTDSSARRLHRRLVGSAA
ncbi:deoxyguanosinetriphosphate triphosphohydrolase [Actinocrinis puniceicyclus]|uniref:Deoxyguanosinetriphosphate triphosphohydrolase-like protein n=1 Tax=Actinocrinis puniceicyclus TaxID=977794 RepID=A0A8J8BBR2_9ACTN|nr:deoxyguanosinetriphosphate triphosphohydrolase [Actinocrinis puniceicyclus]MBS2964327.1 deoxyguanosinetriphosphate triphosphohydrolase [Actinocrinis puniceicyclus]